MQIKSLDEVINRLQYKADNIKAKLEPSYFTECIEYLKSLPKCDNGWIPCSSGIMPDYGKSVLISFNSDFQPLIATLYEDNTWKMLQGVNGLIDITGKVIAWQPLPQPYVKGE